MRFSIVFRGTGIGLWFLCSLGIMSWASGAEKPQPKTVPQMQAVPLPNHEISFQRNGTEIARYYFGPDLRRPFLFPIIGPSGRSLTRIGHPHDPE